MRRALTSVRVSFLMVTWLLPTPNVAAKALTNGSSIPLRRAAASSTLSVVGSAGCAFPGFHLPAFACHDNLAEVNYSAAHSTGTFFVTAAGQTCWIHTMSELVQDCS